MARNYRGRSRAYKCTYSRYADDISFSTNQKAFPSELAKEVTLGVWELGTPLVERVEKSGYVINKSKTRMQVRGSRQVVTGLTVNTKVNIDAGYYRSLRAQCASVFRTGKSYRRTSIKNRSLEEISYAQLAGMVNHAHYVRLRADPLAPSWVLPPTEKPSGIALLYKRLLFYRTFVAADNPLIVCEGKTDSVYLRLAIKQLHNAYPDLAKKAGNEVVSLVRFFNYDSLSHQVLQMNGGTGHLLPFMADYPKSCAKYAHAPKLHPVIVLIDNDDGAKNIFGMLNSKYGVSPINWKTKAQFYHVTANLYLVKTPEKASGDGTSCIEDAFERAVLKQKLDGKSFNPTSKSVGPNEFGKVVFAEKIIRTNAQTISFAGFKPLLDRFSAVLTDYKSKMLSI